MKRRLSRSACVLLVPLAAIVVMLLVIEGLVRLVMPQQLIVIRSDVWMPVDHFEHQLRPNLDTSINLGEREVRLITDDNGYRIGSEPRKKPTIRILALGDSFLEALQVEYHQTMVARLDEALSDALGERVVTVNTGVSKTGPNHYLLRARHELDRQTYDLVMVYIYLDNDIIKSKIASFKPLNPTLQHTMRMPKGFGRDEIIKAWLYPINDTLEEYSHLYILFKDRARVLLARLGLTPFYFPDVMLRSLANSPRWAFTSSVLKDIAREADKDGTPCVFVLLPANYQVIEAFLDNYVASFNIDREDMDLEQPARMLMRDLAAESFTVLNATQALKAAYKNGKKELYGLIDTHFSPMGHEVVASYLKPHILEQIIASREGGKKK